MADDKIHREAFVPRIKRPMSSDRSGRRGRTLDHHSGSHRPHVLFLIDQLCQVGGAEQALLNIVRLLPENKFRCSLATFKLDSSVDKFRRISCPIHVFPLQRTYGWSGWKMAFALRRFIRSEKVTIVHTFFETSDLWGGLVAKLSGCPVLVSSRRDMGIFRTTKHRLGYKVISPLFDQVITVSDAVRNYTLQHERLDPKKVVTVYNGVDLETVAAAKKIGISRASLGLERASHVIATVANVRPVKGIDILIKAAASVCREFPRAVFLLIGLVHDPEYFKNLQERIQLLKLERNVIFLGKSDNVFSLLKICDVFCLLSRSEGFSNALLEAMACGLPCVATQVGGNSEAINDCGNGFLVPSEDADAAAQRILTLLRVPELAKQMGEAGCRIFEAEFSAQAMVDKMVAMYEELLDARRV